YPGLGATQRLPRLIGRELAKYLIFTGEVLNARTAHFMGLAEAVSLDELDIRIRETVPRMTTQETLILAPELNKIKLILADKVNDLLNGKLLNSQDKLEAKIAKKISYKAPLALKWANQIIDEGLKLGLEQGLQVELGHLEEIFSTEDAYEGLTSILERRRPTYKGM
ncbi:unnamed protein product, partial [marine sediment metagenome]